MLHHASQKLHSHSDQNDIDRHSNEFTHLFLPSGQEIDNLREIPPDIAYLVCAKDRNFRGVIDTAKMVPFGGSLKLKKRNIQKCLFTKTYKWMRDNMLEWAEDNERVEVANKFLDLNKQTGAIPDVKPVSAAGVTQFSRAT